MRISSIAQGLCGTPQHQKQTKQASRGNWTPFASLDSVLQCLCKTVMVLIHISASSLQSRLRFNTFNGHPEPWQKLTLGAATLTRVWQPGVRRLFSASWRDRQRPTAPMDQMPRFLLGLMLAFWQIWVTSSSHTPAMTAGRSFVNPRCRRADSEEDD